MCHLACQFKIVPKSLREEIRIKRHGGFNFDKQENWQPSATNSRRSFPNTTSRLLRLQTHKHFLFQFFFVCFFSSPKHWPKLPDVEDGICFKLNSICYRSCGIRQHNTNVTHWTKRGTIQVIASVMPVVFGRSCTVMTTVVTRTESPVAAVLGKPEAWLESFHCLIETSL